MKPARHDVSEAPVIKLDNELEAHVTMVTYSWCCVVTGVYIQLHYTGGTDYRGRKDSNRAMRARRPALTTARRA